MQVGVGARPIIYRFFDRLPERDHNLGEADLRYPTYPVGGDKTEWLWGARLRRLRGLRSHMWAGAGRHALESVMQRFLDALRGARDFDFPLTVVAGWRHRLDVWRWQALKRLGVRNPLEGRYLASQDGETAAESSAVHKRRGGLV